MGGNKKPKTIDSHQARRLAVEAETDPRTIQKALRGETVRGMSGERARNALKKAGLLGDEE